MQILQGLLEEEHLRQTDKTLLELDSINVQDSLSTAGSIREAEERSLLEVASQIARHKVVAKRPVDGPKLGGILHSVSPTYEIAGSVNRWDVYVLDTKT